MSDRAKHLADSPSAAPMSLRRSQVQRSAQVQRPTNRRGLRRIAKVFIALAAVGLVGTVALPAYALSNASHDSRFGTSTQSQLADGDSQTVSASQASAVKVGVDSYTATSAAELEAQKQAAANAAAVAAAKKASAQLAAYSKAYTGPTAADYLKNPPYPSFSLAQVFSVAQKYQGTPYVYGGATPAGFDCSGFVMFVYAQFGISLPHSVSAQGAIGTRISPADARPGDVIIFDDGSHDGFYAGPGMILDAPHTGASVTTRPLWTNAYYIVRFGIS